MNGLFRRTPKNERCSIEGSRGSNPVLGTPGGAQETENGKRRLHNFTSCLHAMTIRCIALHNKAIFFVQMEKKEKKEEWSRVQADVSKWKADEQSKKVAKRNAADAIKRDREAQLEGYQHQRLVATLLRHASEAHALEVLKKESQASLQAEKAARDVARREMENIFEKNRAAKAAQLEAKRMEQEEDQRYMSLYAEMLDKQDAQRKEQLQKIRNAQDTQAKLVVLPTSDRRWVDEGVIEQQAASREILESKRELERKRKEAKSAEEFKRDVANQLKDKAALEARAKEERLKDKAALEAISKQVKQEQRQRAMSLTAAKQQQRKDLNDQIVARRMARQSKRAMNAIERKLNARRLQQAAVALQKSF